MYMKFDNIKNYNNDDYLNFFNELNDIDKEKINKLFKTKDKQLSILARILLKELFIQKYKLDYSKLNFNYNIYGKPFIEDIYFNISHSFDYSIVVTSYKRIGVDIEKIRKVDLKIIDFFCTPKEKEYILNSNNKYKSLFEIFCLKEAYFKMLGKNIFQLKDIEFIIDGNSIKCSSNLDFDIYLKDDILEYIIAVIEEKNYKN